MGLFSRKKDEVTHIIDLREPAPSRARWGSPVPCPECSGRGYLDHIDPYREVMFMHCTQCDARYELAKADLESAASEAFTV
jgi:hypothetical protein